MMHQHMLRGLFIAMLIISGSVSSGIVRAGPYEDGSDAYARDDYATALRIWRPLAEQGNRDAQTAVGMMYRHGMESRKIIRKRRSGFGSLLHKEM